jgi:rare lipoprotein A
MGRNARRIAPLAATLLGALGLSIAGAGTAVASPLDHRCGHGRGHCASGIASWYGKELQGRRTANGEAFDPSELTAAHPSLPFQTRLLVTNPANGRSVTVRVNDRGPGHGRLIDLSEAAARQIGIRGRGCGRVEMRVAGTSS